MRSIPAWAGETRRDDLGRPATRVYPRVGGGNDHQPQPDYPGDGLSPRGRGKPAATTAVTARIRSIPAWAGETASSTAPIPANGVYPRVGGGNILARNREIVHRGLSPRGRGKLCQFRN